MALMTGEQYIESIRRLPMEIYMFGKKVENPVEDPILRPALNSVRMTYDLAQTPEYQDLMTAVSPFTGERINRFSHIHQSTEDLRNKVKMQRLMGQKTAACFQRCVGMDAFNAEFSTTYDIDKKYGTSYHENFKRFLIYCQENDLTVDGAMTDPKGDRSKAPHAQEDPDLYLRVVERREDGIVVRGAKAHQTGILNSHEVIVMPTVSMGPDDQDYAVSFAVPLDAKGLFMIIGRQSCDTRKREGSEMDVGNSEFGGVEALAIFDDVFVPNERIFMNGETEFAGVLVERFAGYHRQSYGGCKVGVGDVLIGAAAVAAEYNGAQKASHVKDKLIEMTHLNETLYCCGIACSAEGYPTEAGNYMIDLLLANVCKQNVTRFPYEIARLAEDIAGGLMVTAPSEADLRDPHLGPYVEKYLKGVGSVSTENRLRILRLIENLSLGTAAVGYRTESMHGAGSPQAQRIMIARQGNLEHKKALARAIAHIKEESFPESGCIFAVNRDDCGLTGELSGRNLWEAGTVNTRIQQVLDDKVRPQLALHRGDLELLRVEDGVVVIRLLGQCAGCPSASLTAQEFIFEELARAIPEVKKVVAEQKVSDNLLQQAKDILRRRHE